MAAIQLQWGLDQTTLTTLNVVRNIIFAASTDNIQAKAILACEGFGATIAICPETSRKIELTVVPMQQSTTLNFIACAIGYSKGDCVAQLSQSLAGVKFLGLAAALVTTLPIHLAGDLVATMIAKSAADQLLVPSRRQTTDLLKSIEGRCFLASFADDVYGWKILLESTVRQRLAPVPGRSGPSLPSLYSHPGVEGVATLVDAFRQLHRVGESHITKITIHTVSAAPWTIAFVKWCLGRPPTVMLGNGTCILNQDDSSVDLIMSQSVPSGFKVTLHSSVASPSTLIETNEDPKMVGMISIESYGKLLLQDYNFKDNFSLKVLSEAISFGTHRILQDLVVVGGGYMDSTLITTDRNTPESNIGDTDMQSQRLSPFPNEAVVLETCGQLLGSHAPKRLRPMADGLTVLDLPLLRQHIDTIRTRCPCAECTGSENSTRVCLEHILIEGITIILGTILVLLLFDRRESLLVRAYDNYSMTYTSALGHAIKDILGQNSGIPCKVFDILRWALFLVRHDEIPEDRWLLSCKKGQAVWPVIFESNLVSKYGYLQLLWLPGKLHFQSDTYDLITSKPYNFASVRKQPSAAISESISVPCNLFLNLKTGWQIAPQDGVLEASIVINEPAKEYNKPWIFSSPYSVITSLAEALLVDDCCHGRNASLAVPDKFCSFLDTFSYGYMPRPPEDSEQSLQFENEHPEPGFVWIIPVDGSIKLRIAALGMNR